MSNTPTVEELQQLPRWAIVAFAARCVRRMQSLLYPYVRSEEDDFESECMRGRIVDAEKAAAKGGGSNCLAALAARQASILASGGFVLIERLPRRLSSAAGYAAHAATRSVDAVKGRELTITEVVAAIRQDFELLIEHAKSEQWTDDTPVARSVFGPLWPEGKPDGWPTDASGRVAWPPLWVPCW